MGIIDTSRILACGAHPDDIEYGCLGTILKCKPEKSIAFIGSCGGYGDPSSSPDRLDESRLALTSFDHLYVREGIGLEDQQGVTNTLEGIIASWDPTLILTLGPRDTHQDHILLSQYVLTAARRSTASILFYGILSNTPQFTPTLFVDISKTYDQKLEALACHKSQAAKYYMSREYLDVFNTHQYSRLRGIQYAEAFEVFRILT